MKKTALVTIEVNYDDLDKIWLHFTRFPNSCFLDSSMQHEALGRYSYIAHDPFLLMTSKGHKITCNGILSYGNPFDFLKEQLALYQGYHHPNLPDFQGGAVGYFGYDLLHHLEQISSNARDEIAIPDLCVGFYDCIMAFDHQLKQAWIISQGFPETTEPQRSQRARGRALALADQLAALAATQKKTASVYRQDKGRYEAVFDSNLSKKEYCQRVEKTIEYINNGEIFQANIAQCFSVTCLNEIPPQDLYTALRCNNPAPFSALLNFESACLASSSPERYLKVQQHAVEARPIKGTIKRGLNSSQDNQLAQELLASEKDKAENTMIVDLMRNDLSRVCWDDSINVTQWCGLETYASVHHLVSVIEGRLKSDEDALSLLKATFPPGSITGAPKVRAMEIIYELEPTTRAAYCGSIGFIGFDGSMDMSVVIRTFTLKNKTMYFQAGCGIVADSIPEKEYEESQLKANALIKTLYEVCHIDFTHR